jgi:hypothetical protein
MTMPQNEAEWKEAVSAVVQAMQAHVEPFVTPLSTVIRDEDGKPIEGKLLGTGSYISALGQIMLITNEHNFAKLETNSLGLQFRGNDCVFHLHCPTYSSPYPWDVGFSRIDPKVWNLPKLQPHTAAAIPQSRPAPMHWSTENELLFFAGYAWQGSTFLYDTLLSRGTPYTMREVPLPEDWGEERFHFAIDYRPDLAETVGRGAGLPRPDGFSGSLVWNTHYVECVTQGKEWSSEDAEVTGIVWGWPSATGCLIATRIEHVRSFLLHAIDMMAAKGEITVS